MSNHDILRQTLVQLRAPISDQDTLVQLLSTALKVLGIYYEPNDSTGVESPNLKMLLRYIPEYQTLLLESVAPHWEEYLRESENLNLITDYFVPPAGKRGPPNRVARMEPILSAYSTVTNHISTQLSIEILATLNGESTPSEVFRYLFDNTDYSSVDATQRWADFLKYMFSIPGKASNAAGSRDIVIPKELETGTFFTATCSSWNHLVQHTSCNLCNENQQEAVSVFLSKLVSMGCFPLQPPLLPSDPSFWKTSPSAVAAGSGLRPDASTPKRVSAESSPRETKFRKAFTCAMSLLPVSQQHTIVASLLSHVNSSLMYPNTSRPLSLEGDDISRSIIKEGSLVLLENLGNLDSVSNRRGDEESHSAKEMDHLLHIWPVTSALLDKQFSEGIARVLVCWASQSASPRSALESLLNRALELWSNQDHIRHSTLQRHRAVTCLFLNTILYIKLLPPKDVNQPPKQASDVVLRRLATNSAFISAVGVYIEHPEPSVRRCGMLTAELVAEIVGSKLQFPGWEDEGDGQEWGRRMRNLLQARDVDATIIPPQPSTSSHTSEATQGDHKVDAPSLSENVAPHQPHGRVTIRENDSDSDDSLEGYASSTHSSSRAPSPVSQNNAANARGGRPSNSAPTIDEINADPTLLNPLRKKIQKPVYLLDLGRLLKVDKDGNEQSESIQVALDAAASLIRKKAGWGLELEENAVDLTHSLIGLQNNYELEEFDHRVLEALTALVVRSPRKAPLCIIEHFFTPSYSTSQRFTMLNALALGARELAGLPTPQISRPKSAFPSKLLPPSLHRRYYTTADESDAGAQIRGLVENISKRAINSGLEKAEDSVPEIVRERQLTVRLNQGGRAGGIVELQNSSKGQPGPPTSKPANTFNEIAAEYFILPLVAKFWDYLQDTLSREERNIRMSRNGEGGFRAAGTAMILSPLVLSHFINTMSIMVHASRHSPAFLSILAPKVLELAITLGTRKMISDPQLPTAPAGSASDEDSRRSASTLSASLELAIVILDASIALDTGKTLALEHGSLVSGTTIWARKVFETLDAGLQLQGMGGEEEARLRGASAGLLLKLEEISSKWSQAMLIPF